MQTTKGVAAVLQNDDDDGEDVVDPHLECIKNEAGEDESDEEDEDFVAGSDDDGGSPTDESGGEDSDDSESGDDRKKPSRKEEVSSLKAMPNKRLKDGDEGGSEKRKQKKEMDPNASKSAMNSFMFFLKMDMENAKKTNPRLTITEISKISGDKWRNMSAEEREPFEAMARADETLQR